MSNYDQYGGAPPPPQPPQQPNFPPGQYAYGAPPPGQYPNSALPLSQYPYGGLPPGQYAYGAPPPGQYLNSALPLNQYPYGGLPSGQYPYGVPPPGSNSYSTPFPGQSPTAHPPQPPSNQPPPVAGYPPPGYSQCNQQQASPAMGLQGGGPPMWTQSANPSPGYAIEQQPQGDVSTEVIRLKGALDGLAHRKRGIFDKGTDTNETTLIEVLSNVDPAKMQLIRNTYKTRYNTSLVDAITKIANSRFRHGLLAIVRGPLGQDVHNVYNEIVKTIKDEAVLNDVLLSRSNADLEAIKTEYQNIYKRSLMEHVTGGLSGNTKTMFEMVLEAKREESTPLTAERIQADVTELYTAGKGKFGTDERSFCAVVTRRSDAQLNAISNAYEGKYKTSLDKAIDDNFSSHAESALHHIVRGANNRPERDAQLLKDTTKGAGTKHELLINRIVRFHWNRAYMAEVTKAYERKFKTTLIKDISEEQGVKGAYLDLMIACLVGNVA